MKSWLAFMVIAVLLAVGLFAYIRMNESGAGGADDPNSGAAKQSREQGGKGKANARRRSRIAEYIDKMRLTLDEDAQRRLVAVLDGFQDERTAWWIHADLEATDYDERYTAFVRTYIDRVKSMLRIRQEADLVVSRFLWDGRIIRPPVFGKDEVQGKGGARK